MDSEFDMTTKRGINDETTESLIDDQKCQPPKEFCVKNYEDLPPFLTDNHFIRTGYRVHFTFKLCLHSLFKPHNELLCIWTHLLGTVLFIALLPLTWFYFLHDPTPMDVTVFNIFFIGAICQMLFSTLFHTFNCHSPHTYKWLARLDYTGICMMIVGSYFPPLYYGFACRMDLKSVYMSLISLLGIIGVCVSMIPIFQTPRFRTVRAVFFLIFGWFAIFPFPHMILINGFVFMWPFMWRELMMGLTYVFGAVIYSTRFPERCWPGKFDKCGSHVIWHLFTIVAACMQFYFCLYIYYNRLTFHLLCESQL